MSPEEEARSQEARNHLIRDYFARNSWPWRVGTIYGSTWRRFVLGRESSNRWLVARMPGLDRVVGYVDVPREDS